MRLLRLYIALLFSSTFFYACSDFEETDLSEETVVLLAPGDCTTNDENNQLFVWEDLTEDDPDLDVEYYNLQIAEPDFTSPLRFVLDSNISGDSYEIILEAGTYEWRVRAENTTSRTAYTTYQLTVDSNFYLTNSTIEAIYPLNETVNITGATGNTIIFQWEPVLGADLYTFKLVKGTINSPSVTLKTETDIVISESDYFMPRNDKIEGVDVGPGDYQWRVTAKNIKTNTNTTNTFSFTVDTLATN